jgi:serine/threonine protein phosphatase 1
MSHFPAIPVRRFAANPTGRDLIVGDVHGCFTKLRASLDAVGFDPGAGDRLFSVGDLVDRGPESADVLWWLEQPWFAAVRGNHEDMAVRWGLPGCAMDRLLYVQNGGGWNVGNTQAERLRFSDALGALPMAIQLETAAGTLGLVHADCPLPTWGDLVAALEDRSLSNNRRRALCEGVLWSRDRAELLFTGGVPDVRAVVVGHTPVERVTSLGNVFFIDTAAWFDGGAVSWPFAIVDAATLALARHPAPGWTAEPAPVLV